MTEAYIAGCGGSKAVGRTQVPFFQPRVLLLGRILAKTAEKFFDFVHEYSTSFSREFSSRICVSPWSSWWTLDSPSFSREFFSSVQPGLHLAASGIWTFFFHGFFSQTGILQVKVAAEIQNGVRIKPYLIKRTKYEVVNPSLWVIFRSKIRLTWQKLSTDMENKTRLVA